MADAADRRWRIVRSRAHDRREHSGADDYVRNEPGDGHSDLCRRARSVGRCRPDGAGNAREGAPLHGPSRRQAAAGAPGQRRLHRELHEFTDLRPARCSGSLERPQGPSRCAHDGCSWIAAGEAQAIAEGLDRIFRDAGAEFREAGCSMCIAVNGDQVGPGEYCLSTSNRNFEGRQGQGARTFLASPLTAVATAVAGVVTDARPCCDGDAMTFESRIVVLPIDNVDTDQIIPARFLKTLTQEGLGDQLFYDWRYDQAGRARPDFVLNHPGARDVARPGGRQQLRLWQLARARRVGADAIRISCRGQQLVCRHLRPERAQERTLADCRSS